MQQQDLSEKVEDFKDFENLVSGSEQPVAQKAEWGGRKTGLALRIFRKSQVETLLAELGVDKETRAKFEEQDLTPESLIEFSNEEFRELGINAGLRYRIRQSAAEVAEDEDYGTTPKPDPLTEKPENMTPPATGSKNPDPRGGKKCYVDVGFEVLAVGDIDTCNSQVSLQLQIVYYWTDSRFIGWPEGKALPPDTWGPAVRVKNEKSTSETSDVTFAVFNAKTGRMKRCVLYQLNVAWVLDENLPNFPFDAHDFTVWFRSASDFISFDGSNSGNSATEHQYLFRAAKPVKEVCGSSFLKVIWDRRHHGWKCHGIGTELEYEGIVPSGYEPTNLKLHFHISRRSNFFWFQMLIPLYLTTLLSWSAYLEDIDTGLEARVNGSLTCLLAQFALLYVVQEHLPNLPFLTALDYAVFTSIFCTGLAGVSSMVVHWIDKYYSAEWAEKVNDNIARLSIFIYVVVNLYHVVPKVLRKGATIDSLLESGVNSATRNNALQCKKCKKHFDTDKWAEHQEKKADCSAEGFIVEETLIFCNKESHKFDVDESSSAAANAKAKNYLYLADNHAKDLYPKYEMIG